MRLACWGALTSQCRGCLGICPQIYANSGNGAELQDARAGALGRARVGSGQGRGDAPGRVRNRWGGSTTVPLPEGGVGGY
jgi:hypothetical protein